MIGYGKAGINSYGSIITLDTFNNRVLQHQVFSFAKRAAIAANDILDIIFDPTLNGGYSKKTLIFLPITFKGIGAQINIDLYIGTQYTGGTEWGTIDRSQKDGNAATPHMKIIGAPTITDAGVLSPLEFSIYADGVGASMSIGGDVKEDFMFEPDYTKTYRLRLTNTSASAAVKVNVLGNFFEV